ncbi:MAG: ligase-associated DNA damage response endonuclease PdeM [Litoreibacter sp.]|nr:ligase-associated DNA damage response endonuclease PdeM [Litoreibacter sp.]
MNFHAFDFAGTALRAYGSGGLYWPAEETLIVSDLPLGKSERIARRSGQLLPPYETRDTLVQLDALLEQLAPRRVICLGDSFDDLEASHSLPEEDQVTLTQMMIGHDWIWIEGNHDPGPLAFGGTHLDQLQAPPLTFRHIAEITTEAEISGHFHPKTRLFLRGRNVSRPCFLVTQSRLIMPAFGTYTGGLSLDHSAFEPFIDDKSFAIVTGRAPCAVPVRRVRSGGQAVGFS